MIDIIVCFWIINYYERWHYFFSNFTPLYITFVACIILANTDLTRNNVIFAIKTRFSEITEEIFHIYFIQLVHLISKLKSDTKS